MFLSLYTNCMLSFNAIVRSQPHSEALRLIMSELVLYKYILIKLNGNEIIIFLFTEETEVFSFFPPCAFRLYSFLLFTI